MKKWSAIATLALILSIACHSEYSDTASNTDTSNTVTSSPEMAATVPSADTSATTTGVTGGTVTYMSDDDKTFVTKAAQGGLAEVGLGTTAQQRASSADVKKFAARMISDHSKANEELKSLAITKGLGLPTSVDEKTKELGDKLNTMSGAAFDRAYMKEMVDDHEKDVAEFDKASREAQDADVKRWAASKLPILKEHLAMAKDIQRKMR
jgi:putative membrane protein